MNNVWEDYKETVVAISNLKLPSQWTLDTIDRYVEGLFSFSKFKVGHQVEMANTYPVSKEESPGWWCYRHLLVRGSKAKINSVDWRHGRFVYYIQFNENSWMDDKNVIHNSDTESVLLCLFEKWLTDKVDVE